MTSILAMRAKSRNIAVRMNIWYRRLEHIDKRTIKMLIQQQLVDSIDMKKISL